MTYKVTFTSSPSGASVYLVSYYVGKTPVTATNLEGNYLVYVKLAGYPDREHVISPADNGKTIHTDFAAAPVTIPGVTVVSYGTGTGQSNGYVSGAKNVFTSGETVWVAWRLSDTLGGKTSTIDWLKDEAGSWVKKGSVDYTFASGSNWGYHWSTWYNMGDGKWKIDYKLDGKVLATSFFTYGVVAPPPAPEVPIIPALPPPEPRKIAGTVTGLFALPVPLAKVTFVGKSAFSGANGYYEILEPAEMSAQITCELLGYETITDYITAPLTGTLIKNFALTSAPPPVPPPPPPIPEVTWWEKLLDILKGTILLPWLTSKELFNAGWMLLTGKVMTDAELEKKRLEIADWILPVNVIHKLFYGKNIKGETEEFGSASDWITVTLSVAALAVPGPVDDAALRISAKSITSAEAAKLTAQFGDDVTIAALKKTVLAHPENSAKILAAFPAPVREAVIAGLYKTAAGREAVYALGKLGYWKALEPFWKKVLTTAGASVGIAGLFVTAIGSYPFAGFLKEEALQTLDFAVRAATENRDAEGLRKALEQKGELLDSTLWEKILAAIPFVNILDILRDFYSAAKTKLEIDEAGFEAKKAEWEEEAAPRGTLTIRPFPTDAKVSVEGQIPTTGVFSSVVPVGNYTAVVSKFGYKSQSKILTVKADEITDWLVTLEVELAPIPLKATLIIRTDPTNANISVAGFPQITKAGTYTLDAGTYSLDFSLEGYSPERRTVYLDEGETEILSVSLKIVPPALPERAALTITSSPSGASVYIDGKWAGTITPYTTKLDAGLYRLRVEKKGYEIQERDISIEWAEARTEAFVLIAEELPPPVEVPKKSKITIKSEPTTADVYLDGIYTYQKTPYTAILDAGEYLVRLQKSGYYPTEVTIEVEYDEVGEIVLPLEKIPSAEVPTTPYVPSQPYVPYYPVPPAETVPVYTQPYYELPAPDYSYLEVPEKFYTPPVDVTAPYARELILNIETTDVLPFRGRITSIAWIDLSSAEQEAQVMTDEDEEGLITTFLDWFDKKGFTRIVGFNVSFDHRFIFAKAALYRRPCPLWGKIEMRDIMQILQQVQEKFVYSLNKAGTLDEWGKELLGYGKYGTQEEVLQRFIRKDFDYVSSFNINQVNLIYDLYALLRYTLSEAQLALQESPQSTITPQAEEIYTPSSSLPSKKKCPNCLQENPIENKTCFVCGAAI